MPELSCKKTSSDSTSGGVEPSVIGGAIGGILLAIIAAVAAILIMRRRRNAAQGKDTEMVSTNPVFASMDAWRKSTTAGAAAAPAVGKKPAVLKAADALPPNWSEFTDDNGKVYYYNSATQQSVWDRPTK